MSGPVDVPGKQLRAIVERIEQVDDPRLSPVHILATHADNIEYIRQVPVTAEGSPLQHAMGHISGLSCGALGPRTDITPSLSQHP